MYTYLKDEIYYSELYDKHTIEKCKRFESRDYGDLAPVSDQDKKKEPIRKDFTDKVVIPFMLVFVKGERYRNKADTIRQWLDRDRQRDEKLASAVEPSHIRCLGCSSIMDCTDRDLFDSLNPQEDRVLFMFKCPKCGQRRAYWDNGEEWQINPTPCPKCDTPMTSVDSRKGNIITSVYTCPKCGHTKTDTLDLNVKHEPDPIDPNFEADRKKYCLSEKEGSEYVSQADRMKGFHDKWKDKEENKAAYEAVAKIKTISIADLKALLGPLVQQAGYGHLEVGQPDLIRGVSVEFKLEDITPGRSEYDSTTKLGKLIKKALEGTNWHLMSEGIKYRLGFLSGGLRGGEGEGALLELANRNIKKV